MSNEIMIPEEIPAYLMPAGGVEAAVAANEDALDGLSMPMPPSIGISGTRFVLKKSDGTDEAIKTTEIQMIILRCKKAVDKSWYATKYDPNQTEFTAPDCFSTNGATPDPSSKFKQNESCAGCKQNVFGSGTGADGEPSKGKACSDNKILAVFYKGERYRFKVPPASLKSFVAYVRALSSRGLALGNVITTVGFSEKFTYAVLTFDFAGFVPEQHLGKLAELTDSQEVKDIIEGQQSAPALPAPDEKTPKPAKEEKAEDPVIDVAVDLGLGEPETETVAAEPEKEEVDVEAEKKAKKAAQAKARRDKKKKEEAEAAAAKDNVIDMGLGEADEPKQEEAAGPVEDLSDEDLAGSLGL